MVNMVGVILLRKIILILMIISLITVAGSCDNFIDPDIEGKKQSEDLLKYLSDKDEDGLKSMFCEKTASSSSFDKQIKVAIDVVNGKVTSSNILINSSERSVKDGKTTSLDISAHISEIETDVGKVYDIRFYSYLVNSEYEDKEGISMLTIKSDDGKECIVGKLVD